MNSVLLAVAKSNAQQTSRPLYAGTLNPRLGRVKKVHPLFFKIGSIQGRLEDKKRRTMKVIMQPVGFVRTEARQIPKHFSISQVEGELVIDEAYRDGLEGISPGDRIVVLFWFHKSEKFSPAYLKQYPRGDRQRKKRGVFNLCSPIRPNAIGLSIVHVLEKKEQPCASVASTCWTGHRSLT